MASESLDPEPLRQARTIAGAIPARRGGLEISTVPEANRPPRPMRTGHYFRCRSALSYRSIKASASQYTDSVLMRPASSTS